MWLKQCLVVASIVASILIFIYFVVTHLGHPIDLTWDDAMYLQGAQIVLAGGVPYVDFVDVNPPLIIYLSMVPALISIWTTMHIITAFKVFALLLILSSNILCYAVLWRRLNSIECGSFIAILLVAVVVANGSIEYDFGQREHLFLVLYLPYLFLRWNRWEGARPNIILAIVCGVFAAVGLCLKHYFLLLPLLTEVFWFITKRNWRNLFQPETYACVLVGLCYGAHILLWPETVRKMFFEVVAHMNLFQEACGRPISEALVMHCYSGLFWLMVSVLVLAIFLRNKHRLIVPLSLFTIGGWLSFVIQDKEWTYHRLPVLTGIILLGALEIVVLMRILSNQTIKIGTILKNKTLNPDTLLDSVLFAILIAGSMNIAEFDYVHAANIPYGLSIQHNSRNGADSKNLESELKALVSHDALAKYVAENSVSGDPVLILNANVIPAYPLLLQFNRSIGSRYPWFFPIAEFETGKRNASIAKDQANFTHYQEEEDRVLNNVASDILRFKPKLIIAFGKEEIYCPPEFSFSDLVEKPGIAHDFLKGYHFIGSFKAQRNRDSFSVYKRY